MIWIDYREKDLIAQFDAYVSEGSPLASTSTFGAAPSSLYAPFRVANLPIGDIIISNHPASTSASEDGVKAEAEGELTMESILLIIERKTVMDLAASIRDGRYEEQGFRLNDAAVPNHNIVYLVEGDVQRVLATNCYAKNRITPDAMYGAFASIMFFKGFSLYHSLHLSDTCAFICHAHRKLHKEMGLTNTNTSKNTAKTRSAKGERSRKSDGIGKESKRLYYSDISAVASKETGRNPREEENGRTSDAYEATLKKKHTYTTTRGVQIAMLCQIPKVSVVIATALVDRFGSLSGVTQYICSESEGAARLLAEFKYKDSAGKERRVSKAVAESLEERLRGST